MKNTRIGRFKIAHDAIEKSPEIVMAIMGKMIITRAESLYYSNEIEYVAASRIFREVHTGEKIPEYRIIVISGEEDYEISAKEVQ